MDFNRHVVVIEPGGEHPYEEDEWRDALVMLEHGAVVLCFRCGRLMLLTRGAILWFTGLPLRAVHNQGEEPAVLVGISRELP